MTRKTIDCRSIPNEVGCTLAISGEPEEVVTAAAQHAVAVHGHAETPALRDALRAALTDEPPPSTPNAFVQVIEFDTDRIGEWDRIVDEWARAIGDARTTRWTVVGADRDRPGQYVAIVEFPSYNEAMTNSGHAATAEFHKQLQAISRDEPQYRNLDVQTARSR